MINYVNQEKFFDWYRKTSREEQFESEKLLSELFNTYARTKKAYYSLPASRTKSGREERFPFRFENLGCCGASTMYIYF